MILLLAGLARIFLIDLVGALAKAVVEHWSMAKKHCAQTLGAKAKGKRRER